jgi:hypothetical protein
LELCTEILRTNLGHQDRSNRYYGVQQVNHDSANVVTVHDTVVSTAFATQYVTVTVGDQQAQCTQNADALQTSTDSGNQQQQQADATQTAPPQLETITTTRVYTSAYVLVSYSVLYIAPPSNNVLYRKPHWL